MIKTICRSVLNAMGLTLLIGARGERIRLLGNATLRYHLHDPFPFLIESLLQKGAIETILQIGANDGFEFDPISLVVESPRTRCILVEPNPAAFQRLSERHRETPGVFLENLAVSTQGEESMRLWLPADEKLLDGRPSDVLVSGDRALLQRTLGKVGCGTEVRSIEVSATSSRELLARHAFSSLDLLVVDAEGADAAIIRDFPFESHAPGFLLFEHSNLSNPDFSSLIDFLTQKMYRLYLTENDAFAVGPAGLP